jgi:SAM-dependent methyltransferase
MASLRTIGYQLQRVVTWTIASVRQRGVSRTFTIAASVVEDRFFDRRFGIETSQVVNSDQLEASLANRAHAIRYKATKARPFLDLLRRLQLPADSTFVDVGSGKGRVLLLAAQLPFRRVVGIEFSRSLCEQARTNIEIFRRTGRTLAPIEVCEGDVTRHALRGDENVFFLYNPFDAVILSQFVENIRRSLATHPRPIWLIYSVPVHATVLDASGVFARCEAFDLRGNEFRVYTNR